MSEMAQNEEDHINIEVGETADLKYDYSKPAAELEAFVDEEALRIQNAQAEATPEFVFLLDAFRYVDYCRTELEIVLDLTEDTLELLEDSIDKIREKIAAGEYKKGELENRINWATAYLGVVIIKNLGGSWVSSNAGVSVKVGETVAFVNNKMFRRMMNGRIDGIIEYYGALKEMVHKESF